MTTDTPAAIESAYQLLGFIFDAGDLIEVRTLGARRSQHYAVLPGVAKILETVATYPDHTNVFVGANPRAREGGTAADVALARCLVADWDKTTLQQAQAAWRLAEVPEPTVVVMSGGGVHAWWRLCEPITDLDEWKARQKALAQRVGSDTSIHDAPRVMRLPGFINWKYEERPISSVHSVEPDNVWPLDEFPAPLVDSVKNAVGGTANGADAAGSLSGLSRRFLVDGWVMPQGRRTTAFTVACDMKARGWMQPEALGKIMARAASLGLAQDELDDIPRQVQNAFAQDRTPVVDTQHGAKPAPVIGKRKVLTPVGVGDLIAENREMREPIIEGLLRVSEIANLISSPKIGKSMLVNQLALKVARGEAWMGFPVVRPGRVLLIDNELHPETSANRLAKVAEAEKYEISTVHENLKVLNLRGELMDFYQLDENFMQHQNAGDFTLIILDAFYRFLPAGTDENDNGSMARIYNLLDSWATRLNCAFVCIHHSSKGSQAEKQVSDVGSGAGSMSRAADAHIVLRPHKEPGHVVMEALVRSWKPMDPRVLGFSYPKFTLAPHLDPADLARPGKRATEDGWSPQRFVDECWKVDVLPWASVQTIATDVHGIGKARALELREQAQGRGLIYKVGSGAGTLWARKAVVVCDVPKSE